MSEAIDGKQIEKNGLNERMLSSAAKSRDMKMKVIKNALSGMEKLTSGTKYSFYKRNPNLLCTSSGMLMMREKSTLDVIAQIGEAGRLSLL